MVPWTGWQVHGGRDFAHHPDTWISSVPPPRRPATLDPDASPRPGRDTLGVRQVPFVVAQRRVATVLLDDTGGEYRGGGGQVSSLVSGSTTGMGHSNVCDPRMDTLDRS